MSGIFRVTRRDFLRQLGVGGGALVLGCTIAPEELFAQSTADKLRSLFVRGIPLSAFVAIKPITGRITIITHRSEMGQGIKSSLAAVLADEAELDWDLVTLQQADADAVNFGVPFPYKLDETTPAIVKGEDAQFTDSSRSMAAYYMPMRIFGAGLRLVMLKATAMKWNVPMSELEARKQRIHHDKSGRSIGYNHLLIEASKVKPLPEIDDIKPILKKPNQWHFIGKETMPFNDAKDMVTGKAEYGADVKLRGMLTAMIVRCPVANGKLRSFDATAALAVPGVRFVERVLPADFPYTGGVGSNFVPHDGVAVIADNTWAAWKGRRALAPHVQWDDGPNGSYDSEAFRDELKASTSQPGKPVRWKGSVDSNMSGPGVVERDYYVPHLAQTPMEPPAAVARYDGSNWEIWTPTQGPELAQHYIGLAMLEPDPIKGLLWLATEPDELRDCERESQRAFNEALARHLGTDVHSLFKMRDDLKKMVRDRVKVHVTLLGGGFGRKSNPDYAMEAAFLARNHPGVPIRVQWTREDDIQFSFYNAAAAEHFRARLGADGRPTEFLQRSAFTSFFATVFPKPDPSLPPAVNDLYTKARRAFHNGGDYRYGSAIELGQGLEDNPYVIENMRIENSPAENHIRCGWMRSVANIYHAFGLGSFVAELAHEAKKDPKDYLLELIGQGHMFTEKELREKEHVPCYDNNLFPIERQMRSVGGQEKEILPGFPPDTRRLRACVEKVAEASGWNSRKGSLPKGHGLGIAAHRSFLSYVALVVEVSINDKNELKVHDVWAALDCGRVVNPDRVRAQIEGGVLYGLSLALFGEITVKNGAVVQHNFDDYPVLRMDHAPRVHPIFVDPSPEVVRTYPGEEVPPTGVGEPPTAAVAPALANAIFAAGGPRIREIPFRHKIDAF